MRVVGVGQTDYLGDTEHPETSAPYLLAVIPANAGSALLRRSRTSRAFRARTSEATQLPLSRTLPYLGEADLAETSAPSLRSVIPANAGSALLRRSRTSRAVRARTPEVARLPLSQTRFYFGEAEPPEASTPSPQAVIPANAGIQ
ncbi:hypothetical protein [Lysobacter gummosus]|uniref:hypothetical protein n=1 Tax=Lysobacter gummosus TaxID=262324 RepID=UPI003630FE4C